MGTIQKQNIYTPYKMCIYIICLTVMYIHCIYTRMYSVSSLLLTRLLYRVSVTLWAAIGPEQNRYTLYCFDSDPIPAHYVTVTFNTETNQIKLHYTHIKYVISMIHE